MRAGGDVGAAACGWSAAQAGSAASIRMAARRPPERIDMELTVRENLVIYGRYFDLPRAEARRRAKELLEFVQLADRATSRVEPLSGGMKRRVTIARSPLP